MTVSGCDMDMPEETAATAELDDVTIPNREEGTTRLDIFWC